MNTLRKVVIPAAGLGIRMQPATKVISKEMLPLAGKPIIQHILDEIYYAGFEEIIFVSHSKKPILIDYLNLSKISKERLQVGHYEEIEKLSKLKISYVKQAGAKGLGHAILCAKKILINEPFAVVLPDMVIDSNLKNNNLLKMKRNFEESGESSILLAKAKNEDIKNYGIVDFDNNLIKKDFFPIKDVIEKPSLKKAPSNLFIAGRYLFDYEILKYLNKEKPDASGEIQLTGAISNFLEASNSINGLFLNGDIHDCGNKLGYLIANLAFSFKDRNIKKEVLKFTKK